MNPVTTAKKRQQLKREFFGWALREALWQRSCVAAGFKRLAAGQPCLESPTEGATIGEGEVGGLAKGRAAVSTSVTFSS